LPGYIENEKDGVEQIIAAAQLTTAKTDKSVQMQREAEVKVAQHAGK
jgi:hypothetical protein